MERSPPLCRLRRPRIHVVAAWHVSMAESLARARLASPVGIIHSHVSLPLRLGAKDNGAPATFLVSEPVRVQVVLLDLTM